MFEEHKIIIEVCNSAVTAILGLAYPMFVERINDIADKYGTRVMSDRFRKEPSYRCFNVLMVVCIIELFAIPFLIMAFKSQFYNMLLMSIQTICVFTLSIVIVRLYFLIMTYSDPFRCLKRLNFTESSENIFRFLQILIVQGAKNKTNDDLYNDATREFCERLLIFQQNRVAEWNEANDKDKSVADDFFIYPSPIFQALLQIGFRSADPENVVLNKRTNIVRVLYNIAGDFPITDQVYYNLMWPWICRMVEGNHNEWMKQYWNIAVQYYSFKLDQSNEEEKKEKFREFHFMVGVLLFYQKRYDVLRYAFTFTNSYPPKYPLVPSTFTQIFSYCEKFPIDEDPFYLTKYNMFKIFQGANMEYMIEGLLLDHIALLMVRLFNVNDYNITYSNPMELPGVGSTVEGDDYKINRAKALINHLEPLPNEVIEELNLNPEWKQKAMELLERFIEECEAEKKSLSNRRVVSEEKKKKIKKGLIDALTMHKPFLPASEEKDKEDGDEEFAAELEAKLPDELILDNRSEIGSNLEESVIQGLYVQLREFYCGRLLQIGAIKTYLIAYRDFGEALKRLRLTSEYAIVALAVSPNTMAGVKEFNMDADEITYQGNGKNGPVKVYSIPSYTDSMVLIMRKDDVPKYRYRDLKEKEFDNEEYREIESKKHLYSNIDNIKVDNLVLKVKQGFYVHIPKKLEYVCIRILYRLEPDATVVSNVKPINNIIAVH